MIPKNLMFKDVLKSQKIVKFKMWVNGKNELFTAQFKWNNIPVKGMLSVMQNYNIMFSGSPS
jgi:hypothetical protein